MTRDLPIASFLIRVYNAEAYLAEAIESALGQTEKNIEVIVVDDGSTDSSRAIIRRFALQDPRVRVFEDEHKGPVPPLNHGLEVARGKYICVLDADDIAMPDRVEKQAKFLDEHEDYVLIGGQIILIGQAGETIGTVELPLSDVNTALRSANRLAHSAVMYRRAEVLNIGGYDPLLSPAEDYDLWVRLAANYRLGNLPDLVCGYRMHGNQLSSSSTKMVFKAMCVRAAFRSASREMIKESAKADAKDFFSVLRGLGFANSEIADSVIAENTFWVTSLRRGGRLEAASKMLSDLTQQLLQLKCDPASLFRVYSLGILVSLDAHEYSRAVRYFFLAFTSSPGYTCRRVFKKLFTPSSNRRTGVQPVS